MLKNNYQPQLVFSVHGIRTKGLWQTGLTKLLRKNRITHIAFNYGYYSTSKFLITWKNDEMVDRFYEFYSKVISAKKYQLELSNPSKRPSIIAHSFGSYIVAYCMLKYPDVRFDKIIICGSVLPRDFDWPTIILREQVGAILNEFGLKDFWTKIVGRFVKKTGDSGTYGFFLKSKYLEQTRYDYFSHSNYFNGRHIETFWLPFLMNRPRAFQVRHGRDLDDLEEFTNMLEYIGDVIDRKCYVNIQYYLDVEVSLELALSWINVNPDIYTFLVDHHNNIIMGYINAMPVNFQVFEKLKAGQLQDNEISEDDIQPLVNDQEVKIYIMSLAIDSDARKSNEGMVNLALETLLNGLISKLVFYFLNYNIRVIEFVAVGWTGIGSRLCKLFDMENTGHDKYGNPIYFVNFDPKMILRKSTIFENLKVLARLYEVHDDLILTKAIR